MNSHPGPWSTRAKAFWCRVLIRWPFRTLFHTNIPFEYFQQNSFVVRREPKGSAAAVKSGVDATVDVDVYVAQPLASSFQAFPSLHQEPP